MTFSKKDVLTIFLVLLALALTSIPVRSAENDMLDLDLSSLMQIQITSAGRKEQNITDVPASVYVIDQTSIRNSGATSIPELLRMVPGLQVARISSSKWAITSRGFNGTFANKLLVQIDGRSVYTPSYSGVYWDVQNVVLEDIERIEVIRGPGATLWGSNAVNGIINVITKQSSDTQEGLIVVGAGNQEKLLATGRYGTQFNKNTYARFYVNRHDQESHKLLASKTDAYDDWNMSSGGFRLDGDHNLTNSWTLQGDLYHGRNNQIDTLWTETPPYANSQIKNTASTHGHNLLARWTHKKSEKNSKTIQIYYDFTNRDESYLEQTNHTLDVDLQHRFQLGVSHDIVWGLGYRFNKDNFTNTYQVSVTPEKSTTNTLSTFLQDEITLLPDRVWLSLGSKFEHNEYTGYEAQPNIRILFKPQEKHSLWASVSWAVRTPSRMESNGRITTAVIPPTPIRISIFGNSNFDSEELTAYEVGYRHNPLPNFSLDLALFYNDYSKLQSYSQESPTAPIFFSNTMEGKTYGLELAIKWLPAPWLETELGYSYIYLSMDDDLTTDFSPYTTVEGSSPNNQISCRAQIELFENLHFNIWGRYTDELIASSVAAIQNNIIVSDYFSLDANIKWVPIEGIEFTIAGQNLLDSKHLEFVSEQFTLPTEIERSIYAKLNWKF